MAYVFIAAQVALLFTHSLAGDAIADETAPAIASTPEAPTSEDAGTIVTDSAPPEPPYTVWDRLATCESGGDWHSHVNPIYKGGLQFDGPTWARYGGRRYAWRADYASRAEQIAVAERTLAVQGWGAWPACSRRLGLR